MSAMTIGIIGIAALFILLLIGLPVGITMLLVGFFGYSSVVSFKGALGMLKGVEYSTVSNYSMSVVPLFILMGFFAFYSGLSGDLYNFAHKMIGHRKGGLALATLMACGFFSAICGSSTATTATFGSICLPEMKKYNYEDSLATGCISAGGTLGILLPPSVGFILYGIIASVSIGKLFAAGIIPGILLCICYMIVVMIQVKLKPEKGPASTRSSWGDRFKAFLKASPMFVIFFISLGGMFIGWFTASQAAAIGATGSFLYLFVSRMANRTNIVGALKQTGETVGMIFMILIGAYCLGYFFSVSMIPITLANWVGSLAVSRWVILTCILIFYAILGCLMDSLSMVLLTTPIFLPVIISLDFDVVWYGVLMVLVMEMGQITPPVGMNLFIMKGCVGDTISMGAIILGAAPHILAIVAVVILVCVIPQLALWLPAFIG
ncbi:MAG: TRAP transporter large permease [Gracilibacteraceae bacterium]|jgi:tripartite ATP-independent transporter DctM subunit|nr:TRAP transporter large permease [Gracilibacteraceae bacterium]